MRVKSFENQKLIKLLVPITTKFISRQKPNEIISPASKREYYSIETLMGINKITECLDQIYFSIEMLSGFRKKKDSIINRHDYIIFMIENFYLRITSILDRVLRFTNFIFDIGIPERECRESTIMQNNKIKGTEIEVALKDLKKFSDNFKHIRNSVAHSNTFEDKELYPIRDYYYLIDNDTSNGLESYSHICKNITDSYIKDKKVELEKSANEMFHLLNKYFDSVTPFVEKRIKYL